MLRIEDLLSHPPPSMVQAQLPIKKEISFPAPKMLSVELPAKKPINYNQSYTSANFPIIKGPRYTEPYTAKDDLSIFKAVSAFFGPEFRGRVPWSFWETYRQALMSNRSVSSLYHHWEGAINKKYGNFLKNGRIHECISFLEMQVNTDNNQFPRESQSKEIESPSMASQLTPRAHAPLIRNSSWPRTSFDPNVQETAWVPR